MGAFEFENPIQLSARNKGCKDKHQHNNCCNNGVLDFDDTCKGEVSILAPRIFDQCRIKKCLTVRDLGPARIAKPQFPNGNDMPCDGEIIIPPANATDVTVRDFELNKIEVLQKKPSQIQEGCWDISLKYVFTYGLEFRRMDGTVICVVDATNSYILKVTLFGSTQTDITTVSELDDLCNQQKGKPCVYAEGKSIALDAELKYPHHGCGCENTCNDGCSIVAPIAVEMTIGLFTIVKLYRTVSIVVDSLGSIVPSPCSGGSTQNSTPCDSFNRLPFPLELFAPNCETKSCCGYDDSYASGDCEYDDNCGCNDNGSSDCCCKVCCCTTNCNCNNPCNDPCHNNNNNNC